MLGPPKPRRRDEPVAVSLEDLVPPDNFYRHLEARLDLGFVREWVKTCYAQRGRPGIDPVVFFKLQLVMFFEGIRSERKLIETASLNLAHRWYLGYALDEELPDHSSLSRIRDRYGLDVFRRFFERIVEQCQTAGLVWGKELFFDATKVEANASLDSVRPRFAVEAHLADLFARPEPNPADGGATDDGPEPTALPVALAGQAAEELAQAATLRHDWMSEAGRPDRGVVRGHYRRTADYQASATDPDAAPMRLLDGRSHWGYLAHYVVDGGRARVVLGVLATPAEVMENTPMLDLLWRARFRWKLRPRQVTGDTTYGTLENIVAVEDQRVRAYVPLPDYERRRPGYGKQAFAYDADADAYRCPVGQALPFRHVKAGERVRVYQAAAPVCASCPAKPACAPGKSPRRIHRNFDEAYLDRVRGYHATEVYKKAMRKRQVWVEPLFAEAKLWHGLRRFRLRGLEKVNGEVLLPAAGQNLKRLLSRWGWGRRPFPSGAAGAVIPALLPLPAPTP